jgi:FMN phosphatase YigB (HAD superfamily)
VTLKAVAFDVYGTLLRPAPPTGPDCSALGIQAFLEDCGISISYQAWDAAYKMAFFIDYPRQGAGGWREFLDMAVEHLGESVPDVVRDALADRFASRPEGDAYPDALDALRMAKERGLTTAAFTTIPRFRVSRLLEQADGLLDIYFDGHAAGDAKGSRGYYERLIQRLGVAPQDIIAVGDEPFADVDMPLRPGMQAILLDRTGEAMHADAPVIRGLRELVAYL